MKTKTLQFLAKDEIGPASMAFTVCNMSDVIWGCQKLYRTVTHTTLNQSI